MDRVKHHSFIKKVSDSSESSLSLDSALVHRAKDSSATWTSSRLIHPLNHYLSSSIRVAEPVFVAPLTATEITAFEAHLRAWEGGTSQENRHAAEKILLAYKTNAPILDLCDLNLVSLPDCFKHMHSLKELRVTQNRLTDLPMLPTQLKRLYADRNRLSTVACPNKLKVLSVEDNKLLLLQPLSQNLTDLKAAGNVLMELPDFPPTLRFVDVSRNQIKVFPRLCEGIMVIRAWANQITHFPYVPESVKELSISENKLIDFPAKLLFDLEHDLNPAELKSAIKAVRKWQKNNPDLVPHSVSP